MREASRTRRSCSSTSGWFLKATSAGQSSQAGSGLAVPVRNPSTWGKNSLREENRSVLVVPPQMWLGPLLRVPMMGYPEAFRRSPRP